MKILTVLGTWGLSFPLIAGALAAESPAIDLAPLTAPSVRVHVSTTGGDESAGGFRAESGTDYQSRRVRDVAHPPLILLRHEPAGAVAEIIVNPQGQIEYVVARYRHELYLIPTVAVRRAADGSSMQLLLTPMEFQRLPRFFGHRWPAFNSREFRDQLHADWVATLEAPSREDTASSTAEEISGTTSPAADAVRPQGSRSAAATSSPPSLDLSGRFTELEQMEAAGTAPVLVPAQPNLSVPEAANPSTVVSPSVNPGATAGFLGDGGIYPLLSGSSPLGRRGVANPPAGLSAPASQVGQGNSLFTPGGGNTVGAPGGGTSTVRSPQSPPTIIQQPGGVVLPNSTSPTSNQFPGTTSRFAPATGTAAPNTNAPAGNRRPGIGNAAGTGNTQGIGNAQGSGGTPGGAPISPSSSPGFGAPASSTPGSSKP